MGGDPFLPSCSFEDIKPSTLRVLLFNVISVFELQMALETADTLLKFKYMRWIIDSVVIEQMVQALKNCEQNFCLTNHCSWVWLKRTAGFLCWPLCRCRKVGNRKGIDEAGISGFLSILCTFECLKEATASPDFLLVLFCLILPSVIWEKRHNCIYVYDR